MKIPKALQPFEERFINTKLPYLRITNSGTMPSPTQSKVGGVPYLPKTTAYPTSKEGRPLLFLAQINFSEVPTLAGYPQKGLLQFYISDDSLMGLNFDAPFSQDTFRVLYFEEVLADTPLETNFNFLPDFETSPFEEADTEWGMALELKEELVGTRDYRFFKQFGDDFFEQFGEDADTVQAAYDKLQANSGHKIGGYAFFTQEDPRKVEENEEILLFQLDTDQKNGLLWGDMGVCNFFINKTDLENLDFSKVMYNWDCY